MQRPSGLNIMCAGLALFMAAGSSHVAHADGPYRILKTEKVGGDGGFDYVYADSDNRNLYVARTGKTPRVDVFNLDTLAPVGSLKETAAHGVVTDTASHHGFASSSPIVMFDTKTFAPIKSIKVEGRPDGLLADPSNHRVYVLSHEAPNVTVLDAKDGSIITTIDLGGAPEQAAADGKGKIYIDVEDKDSVAVIDTKTCKVCGNYSLNGKGGGNAGLALDSKAGVLYVACRTPQVMVMLNAADGKYLADLPIGRGCDGAAFNLKSGECFSSQGDGTLTVIKHKSGSEFEVEQNVTTKVGAKTCTLDTKTGHILLIAAEFGPAPEGQAAPGGRPRRGPLVPGSFSIIEVGK